MGPIGVKKHLAPFLPSHPVVRDIPSPSFWNLNISILNKVLNHGFEY